MRVNAKTYHRDSNMELLRIVCMTFVVLLHFIDFGLYPGLLDADYPVTQFSIVATCLLGLSFVGVNCFVLISGYYQIRFKIKGLFHFYLTCAFYAVIYCFFEREMPVSNILTTVLLPFSHSHWWFIKCYVVLYLLSPILNYAIDAMPRREFAVVLLLLTVLNVYLGYWWHFYNYNGYNVAHFVYLYFIGAFLRKYVNQEALRRWKTKSVLGYFVFALIWSTLVLVSHSYHIPHWISDSYNNPFVLLSSVCLFAAFIPLEIKSKAVNFLAKSVLAAYFLQICLHDWPYSVLHNGLSYVSTVIQSSTLMLIVEVLILIVYSIAFVLLCCLFDKIRLFFMGECHHDS